MAYDKAHITKLARRLYEGITSQVDEIVLNGPAELEGPDRYIGNLNLSFAYVEGESLIMGLKVSYFLFASKLSCCALIPSVLSPDAMRNLAMTTVNCGNLQECLKRQSPTVDCLCRMLQSAVVAPAQVQVWSRAMSFEPWELRRTWRTQAFDLASEDSRRRQRSIEP